MLFLSQIFFLFCFVLVGWLEFGLGFLLLFGWVLFLFGLVLLYFGLVFFLVTGSCEAYAVLELVR